MSAPLLYKITGPIFLNDGEEVALMKESNGRGLAIEFGAGWSRLSGRRDPVSAWAVPLLVELRGIGGHPASGLVVYGASEVEYVRL